MVSPAGIPRRAVRLGEARRTLEAARRIIEAVRKEYPKAVPDDLSPKELARDLADVAAIMQVREPRPRRAKAVAQLTNIGKAASALREALREFHAQDEPGTSLLREAAELHAHTLQRARREAERKVEAHRKKRPDPCNRAERASTEGQEKDVEWQTRLLELKEERDRLGSGLIMPGPESG